MGLGVTVDRFDSRRLVGNCGKRISNLGESFLVWGGGNIDIIDGRRFFSSKQGFRFFYYRFFKESFHSIRSNFNWKGWKIGEKE